MKKKFRIRVNLTLVVSTTKGPIINLSPDILQRLGSKRTPLVPRINDGSGILQY